MIAASRNFAVQFRTTTAIGLLAASLMVCGHDALSGEIGAALAESALVFQTVDATASGARRSGGTHATPVPSSGAELMIGDKVQVTFFEQLDLGQGSDARMTADARTFYQRLDLTGEHVIGSDGAISIPLLGRFVVVGLTPQEGQAQIVDVYNSVMGRAGEVDIAIVERKPIFVTGIVKTPGAFRFEPGMVALQAIALAGGYDHGAEAAARLIEAQRERERHGQAVERLKWLEARRDRLIKQRGALTYEPRPDGRTKIEGGKDGDIAAGGERRLLEAELAAQTGAETLQKARLANARVQVDTTRNVLGLIGNQIDVRSERMHVLQQMQGRGHVSIENLWTAQKEVGDLLMQKERLVAELVAAEHNIVQTEAEGTKLANDRRLQIERELASVEAEIIQQTAIVEASARMIAALETATSGTRIGEPLRMRILRRTPTHTVTIDADEATDLLPGDVVKVEVDIDTDGAVASVRKLIQ